MFSAHADLKTVPGSMMQIFGPRTLEHVNEAHVTASDNASSDDVPVSLNWKTQEQVEQHGCGICNEAIADDSIQQTSTSFENLWDNLPVKG
jgi:hypothetical protein